MKIKKKAKNDVKNDVRYLPLEDIKKIDDEFLAEMERVKTRLGYIRDKEIINTFQKVILSSYLAEIEIQTLERNVDYEIKLVEIEERRRALKPFRRCWFWRLLLRPITNRAQDIIEERAQIDADIIHSAAEKQLDEDYDKLEQEYNRKPTKREIRAKLKAVIKAANKVDVREAFTEPPTVPATSENVEQRTEPKAPAPVQIQQSTPAAAQLPGQMTIGDVQAVTPAQPTRRPRPPRNCRKPPAQGQ